MQNVERKIMFFFADVGEDEGGDSLKFDEGPFLSRVGQLKGEDRYCSHADGRVLCAWPTPKHRP